MRNFIAIGILYFFIISCTKKATGDVSISVKSDDLKNNSIISNITLYQTERDNRPLKKKNKIYDQDSLFYKYPDLVTFTGVDTGTYNIYIHIMDSTQRISSRILEVEITQGKNSIDTTITFDTIKISKNPNLRIRGWKGFF